MRIIVAGSTTWTNREAIASQLKSLPADTIVVFGDAPGADAIAGEIAAELGLTTEPMVKNAADRQKYGRVAWKGLNERMLATGVDQIDAFHPDVDASTGTKHLIEIAEPTVKVKVFAT